MAEEPRPDSPDDPDESTPSDPAPSNPDPTPNPASRPRPGFGGASGGRDDAQTSGGSGSNPPTNPLEALFGQLGAQFGAQGGGQNPFAGGVGGADLNALMGQLQNAFAAMNTGGGGLFGRGPADASSGVNWEITKDTARKTAAGLGPDPVPDAGQQRALTEAVSIAETWLDEATSFPRVSTTVAAWSRAQWIEKTLPIWRRLVEPVAKHIADAMEGALSLGGPEAEEAGIPGMAGMEQMLRPMLRTSGAGMFGLQLGQGLGRLAAEVVGATDIGLPLSEPGHVVLLPTNVTAFGEGLEQSDTDVTLYLALREAARQRLFAGAPWLREQVLTLVEEYARGITIDTSALEEAVGQLDPQNLQEFGAKLEGGLFEPQKTPEQLATLNRLETMLALVEGWVDEVVTQATAKWMPSAGALAEVVRRSRAAGGPAEATFATLVGLELRPRRMRDAASLWAALRDARGADGRDAVWSHPDLAPTSADLDDPLGFVAGEDQAGTDEEFDAALEQLLAGQTPPAPESGEAADDDDSHGDDKGPENPERR